MRRIRPDNLWNLLEVRPHIGYDGYWDFDGFQETGLVHIDAHWEFKTSTEIHTGVNFTRAGVKEPFEIVDGVTVLPGTYDHSEIQLVYFTDQSAPLSIHTRLFAGGRFGGDRISFMPTLRYRVGERFSSELSIDYNDFDLPVANGDFSVSLTRLRLSYSFTPSILLQALVQYNDESDMLSTNLRFSWLQSANSGLFLVLQRDRRAFRGRAAHRARGNPEVQPHLRRFRLRRLRLAAPGATSPDESQDEYRQRKRPAKKFLFLQ